MFILLPGEDNCTHCTDVIRREDEMFQMWWGIDTLTLWAADSVSAMSWWQQVQTCPSPLPGTRGHNTTLIPINCLCLQTHDSFRMCECVCARARVSVNAMHLSVCLPLFVSLCLFLFSLSFTSISTLFHLCFYLYFCYLCFKLFPFYFFVKALRCQERHSYSSGLYTKILPL